MQNLQQVIINECIEVIKISFNNNTLIEELTDIKIVANKKLTGNSFQISTAYTVLLKYYESNPDHEIRQILNLLNKILIQNYEISEFNYFDKKIIPDDLDTASSIVRVLFTKKQSKAYLEKVNLNKKNEFVHTWFMANKNYNSDYFHSTNIYKINEFYQMDVLLNHLITLKFTFDQNIETSLATYFKKFNLYNYWYIPTLYCSYQYSKLCLNLRNKELLAPIATIVIAAQRELNFDPFYVHHKCKFEEIRKIIKMENINNNWLNIGFLFGIIKNYSRATRFDGRDLQESLLTSIYKNLDSFEPSLYLSMGYTAYKSKILSRIFLLDTLL